jgi:hypothetical protein
MNFLIVKQVSILSFILGLGIGILLLLPIINLFVFIFAMFLIGGAIVLFLKKYNMIGIIDIKEGAIIGALSGFASFLGLSASYLPISSLLSLIFSRYTGGFFTQFLSSIEGFIIGIMLVIFSALMSGLLNSFSGLVVVWFDEFVSGIKKDSKENFDFEIK